MSAPKLRFKEFDANWSLSSLGKMTTYFKGYAFKSESYKDSGIRVIRVSDLGRESIKTDNDSIYIEANKASAYENWIIKKDDIIITTVGSKPHLVDSAVGRPIYVKNNNEGLLNQNLLVLRPIDETVNSYFIYAQLLDKKYLTHIELIQRGNANQSNITVKDLQDFETYITSKKEQTKIASFLYAVDEKISQLTQKHQLLSQYKQGMMQKLFSQQIRFKADDGSEFGEWSNKTIGDVANIKRGASPRPINDKKWFDDSSKIGWVRISDVSKSTKYLLQTEQYLSALGIQKSRLVPKGNLIMSICATIGKPIYTGFDVCIHDGFVVFSELQAIHEYAYYYLEYIEKNWYQYGQPGTQVNLNSDIVSNEDFPFPCLEEQTKIANFLSAIDQKIEIAAQQIEQAKQWKKGLLQQMFV